MENLINTVSSTLNNKLQTLICFYRQITKGLDTVAEEIDNTNLKTAIKALAIESKQYAKEIIDQLKHFNISIAPDYTDKFWKEIEKNINEQGSIEKGGEIAILCKNCEIYFTKFYEDILQEYFQTNNLKDIIIYQLYATQCALMKIKLLNTIRFKQ
jgi:hypothetical protein